MVVAFIGHRNVEKTEALQERLVDIISNLIEKGADTFLFGSKSDFNDMCYDIISKLKETYTNIKRVYVRAMYERVSKDYNDYLLTFYEDTFYPDKVRGAGKLSYVVRNQVIVDMCDLLVTYCNSNYKPPRNRTVNKMVDVVNAYKHNKSGTMMAMLYAQKRKKRIINMFEPA